jgi:hypothetical protein
MTKTKETNKMLISKDKLEQLKELMITQKALQAVSSWGRTQGQVTIDTLCALEDAGDDELLKLSHFLNVEIAARGIIK